MEFVAPGGHSTYIAQNVGFRFLSCRGQEKPPETNVIAETFITLVCPTDGKFEVSAGESR
jgi:hypothetical protein